MFSDYIAGVDAIARSVYHDFPDRPAGTRALVIGDNSPLTGDCPGHPPGSHAGWKVLDVGYYTLGANNYTQRYLSPEEEQWTCLWLDEDVWRVLDEGLFDWERNYIFICRLIQVFTAGNIGPKIMMWEGLKRYMLDKIREKYGQAAWACFWGSVLGDENATWNHHSHMHIGFPAMWPDFDVDISGWIKQAS